MSAVVMAACSGRPIHVPEPVRVAEQAPIESPRDEEVDRPAASCLGGWCWRNPRPQGNTLRAVAAGERLAVAVGEAGTILERRDDGKWRVVDSGGRHELFAVTESDGTWLAAGPSSVLLVRTNGRWRERPFPNPTGLRAAGAIATDHVLFVGHGGTIVRWQNGVPRWSVSGTHRTLYGVWGAGGRAWAVGEDGTVLRFDGGAWSGESLSPYRDLFGIWGASPTAVFAVGEWGQTYRYDGSAWMGAPAGSSTLLGVWGTSERDVYAVSVSGRVLRFDGNRWSREWSIRGGILTAIAGTETALWAVGAEGLIIERVDGRWRSVRSGSLEPVTGMALAADGELFAATGKKLLRLTEDGLSPAEAGDRSARWRSLAVDGSGDLVAVGSRMVSGVAVPAMWRRAGARWLAVPLPASARDVAGGEGAALNDVWSGAGGELFAVGSGGLTVTLRDGAWTTTDLEGESDLRAVHGGPAGVYAVGDGGLYSWHGQGWRREDVPAESDLRDVVVTRSGEVHAVGRRGALVTFDGSWRALSIGPGADLDSVTECGGAVVAAGSGGVVVAEVGGAWTELDLPTTRRVLSLACQDGHLWAGGDKGILLSHPMSSPGP